VDATQAHRAQPALDSMTEIAVTNQVLERTATGTLERSLPAIVDRLARATGSGLDPERRREVDDQLRRIARSTVGVLASPSARSDQAGRLLGLETEGLSPEGAEFETARHFVRLAAAATARAHPRQSMPTKETEVNYEYEMGSANGAEAEGGIYGEADMYLEAEPSGEAELYGEADAYGEGELYVEAEPGEMYEADGLGEAEYYEAEPYAEAEYYEAEPYAEAEYYEADQFAEAGGDYESYGETEAEVGEEYEVALATELLGVQTEAELDQFIGKVLRSARKLAASPAGRALGAALRDAAKRVLPVAGAAIGTYVAPGIGGSIGSKLAADLAASFEGEMEGEAVDPEVADLELARRYVRVANHAGRNLRVTARGVPPQLAAQRALARAVRQSRAPGRSQARRRHRTGRWVRHRNLIIVIGA
jgi:uncharacterized protein (DUF697 family)